MGAAKKQRSKSKRPSVYEYHDYREFINDLLAFLKVSRFKLSKRDVAKKAGVAVGYLPMVLNRKRNLSEKSLQKLGPTLKLNQQELSYLQMLMIISDSNIQEERLKAMKRVQAFGNYKKNNKNEMDVYQYLTNWYYVAIREMSALPDFELEAQWIQKRLRKHVSIGKIDTAITFLIDNEYIKLGKNNTTVKPDRQLECYSGVYRLSLGAYYKQMLGVGAELFEETPKEERNFLSHTVALPPEKVDQLKEILDRALDEVLELTNEASPNSNEVYHVGLLTFPLTKAEKNGGLGDV